MVRSLFAAIASLGLAFGSALAQPPLAAKLNDATSGPSAVSLWRTGDADTTIYLMGTVHVLDPTIDWQHRIFEEAWASADTLILETDVTSPEAQKTLIKELNTHGFNAPGTTLATFFTDEEVQRIDSALSDINLTVASMAPMRPWLANIQVANTAMMSVGGSVEGGLEIVLTARANEQGKSIEYFETVSEQLSMIAAPGDEAWAEALLVSAEDLSDVDAYFADLIGAWYSGNEARLDVLMTEALETSPSVAESLLYERNENWARQLDRIIEKKRGTYFVAVGAAHLVGERSIQDYLKKRGHNTRRLN